MKSCFYIFLTFLFLFDACVKQRNNNSEVEKSQIPPQGPPAVKAEEKASLLIKIKNSVFNVNSETKEIKGKVKDSGNKDVSLFSFEGIVFRADNRLYPAIKADRGFKSIKDLTNPLNLQEAQGVGFTKGASGQSGVSTAKKVEKMMVYCSGLGRTLFVINTEKIGIKNQAFDFDKIVKFNYAVDEHAMEVNMTSVPYQAIIGWFPIDFCNKYEILSKSEKDIDDFITKNFAGSKEKFLNDMFKNDAGFVFNNDYEF
jgi:hypothetical protein